MILCFYKSLCLLRLWVSTPPSTTISPFGCRTPKTARRASLKTTSTNWCDPSEETWWRRSHSSMTSHIQSKNLFCVRSVWSPHVNSLVKDWDSVQKMGSVRTKKITTIRPLWNEMKRNINRYQKEHIFTEGQTLDKSPGTCCEFCRKWKWTGVKKLTVKINKSIVWVVSAELLAESEVSSQFTTMIPPSLMTMSCRSLG